MFLKQSAAVAVGVVGAPFVHSRPKITLRVLGTHVTLQESLRVQAQKDLGINIVFEPYGSANVLQKAATQPESFDLYEQWSNSINVLWDAGTIQPIEKARLTHWNEINSLTKTGRLTPEARLGQGDAPYKLLNVQPNGLLGAEPSELVSFMPYVHNVDSFAYNSDEIEPGVPYVTESWGWLLDPQYKGKVGIVNEPSIGIFDLALAAQARGLVKFNDMGAMSRDEIDRLFDVLIAKKMDGHFGGFWNSVPESVDFMSSGRVVIGSMFSPGVSSLNGQGIPTVYAAPKEGYRGWHGVMCLSSKTQGNIRDAAYDYMNWWLSGVPGAFIARQGYYISNPERSRPYLSDAEWDYWYAGAPASVDLQGTDGNISVPAGEMRSGGSYETRFSNIAVWNTVMPNYEYSLQRWYGLLTT
jgi:putative spermidine/putrescine transport system substrate-binding protein